MVTQIAVRAHKGTEATISVVLDLTWTHNDIQPEVAVSRNTGYLVSRLT